MTATGARAFQDRPVAAQLGDGRGMGRGMRFRHGPIELTVLAEGVPAAVLGAYRVAWERFQTVLEELAAELSALRAEAGHGVLHGPVARRMGAATLPLAGGTFVTPMAAVSGAVADEILGTVPKDDLTRVAINNGGDIAVWLGPGQSFRVAMAGADGAGVGHVLLRAEDLQGGQAGLATSGWRGRSHSLGVADAVTVLAHSAAAADAAATLIANAVDLPDHPEIHREPACSLAPDSDLGRRQVVTHVPLLTDAECRTALASGLARAETYRAEGHIAAAALFLGDIVVDTGWPLASIPTTPKVA